MFNFEQLEKFKLEQLEEEPSLWQEHVQKKLDVKQFVEKNN